MAKEYLQVDGKLILVNGKLVEVPSETESSNAVDTQGISLAATQEISEDIYNSLVGYVNGSPKGVYSSISELQNVYPNGTNGIFLTTDNGKWNYWSGTSWTAGGDYLTNPMTTTNGTVISSNADFAEVGKSITQPIENGYFITAVGYDETLGIPLIRKATSTSDIRGVSVNAPAFCGGLKREFLSGSELRQGLSYVGFAGIVNVIDNGKCTINGSLVSRCMSDDDGTAKPSNNNMGYQIISRVNANEIMIVVEPSADMIQRIKTDVQHLEYNTQGIYFDTDWNKTNVGSLALNYEPVDSKDATHKGYVDRNLNLKADKSYVDNTFATEHEAHSLRKEILDLKEEIYGTILDTTTIDIENEGTIPSVVNVEGTDYNVLPKGDVSVLEVYGDTTRCVNLLNSATDTNLTFNGSGYFFPYAGYHLVYAFLEKGTYTIKTDNAYIRIATSDVIPINGGICNYVGTYLNQYTLTLDSDKYVIVGNGTQRQILADKLMLVRGTQAPTEFQPYFKGLKHTEFENVTIASPNLVDKNNKIIDLTFSQYGDVFPYAGYKLVYVFLKKGTYTIKANDVYMRIAKSDVIPTNGNTIEWVALALNIYTITLDSDKYILISNQNRNDYDKIFNSIIIVKGSVAPTQYYPYYSTPVLSVPTSLRGVEGYRDTLEVRLNEVTKLYDVYKVTKCKTITFNGSENFHQDGTTWSITLDGANTSSTSVVASGLKNVALDSVSTTENSCNLTNGVLTFNIGNHLPIQYFPTNNLVVTFASATTTEEKVTNGLDFEQVTALAHANSSIKIVNPNDIYLNKPSAKLGIVYKKTATR